MGKRKSASSKAAPRKKMEKLETAFCCPFCSHAAAVECVIDLVQEIATASCYVCQESYSTVPDALTEPIDVYNEWIDECGRVNEGVPRRRRPVVYVVLADGAWHEEAEETPLPAETGAGVDGGAEAAHTVPADMDEDADGSEGEEAVEDMDDDDDGSEGEEDVEDLEDYDDFSSDDEEEGEFLEREKFVDANMEALCLWGNAASAGNACSSVCMDPWTCDGAHRIW
ncbi:hypothetical protein ACQ4PT_015615 [Festuca glaucescens]